VKILVTTVPTAEVFQFYSVGEFHPTQNAFIAADVYPSDVFCTWIKGTLPAHVMLTFHQCFVYAYERSDKETVLIPLVLLLLDTGDTVLLRMMVVP
jgi:hypothetical protein